MLSYVHHVVAEEDKTAGNVMDQDGTTTKMTCANAVMEVEKFIV